VQCVGRKDTALEAVQEVKGDVSVVVEVEKEQPKYGLATEGSSLSFDEDMLNRITRLTTYTRR
jgi:hypothetical protein